MPNPLEVASIIVGGREITNWESVMVQLRWGEAYDIFEFTTAEALSPAPQFVQSMPNVGQQVTVKVGGREVITGPITVRQSAEDPRRHTVQLVGKSWSSQMSKSTIKNETNNYDGMNILQIAQLICGEVGVEAVAFGDVNLSPFPKMGSGKGQPSWDFLEHLAREKAVVLSSNEKGQCVLIGKHSGPYNGDALTLPGNIERINVIFSNETVYSGYQAFAQDTGSDASSGEASSQPEANASGIDPFRSNWVVPNEHATSQRDVEIRVEFEQRLHDATQITVYATVQGWFRPNGDIWRAGWMYLVKAPNHLVYGGLKAKSVTFTQDDENGTQTTLELVKPGFLNGTLLAPNL